MYLNILFLMSIIINFLDKIFIKCNFIVGKYVDVCLDVVRECSIKFVDFYGSIMKFEVRYYIE